MTDFLDSEAATLAPTVMIMRMLRMTMMMTMNLRIVLRIEDSFSDSGTDSDDDEDVEDDNDDDDESDEDDENSERPRKRRKSEMTKRTKKTIFDIYEPSELKRGHLTDIDDEIRNCDLPERMQLRSTPITPVPEYSVTFGIISAKKVGGDTVNTASAAILKKLLDDSVAEQFSWDGKQQKKEFKTLLTAKLLRKAVHSMCQPACTDLQIKTVASQWLAQVLQRCSNISCCVGDLWKVYKYDAKWCKLPSKGLVQAWINAGPIVISYMGIIKPELNMNDLWKVVYKYDAKWCELRQRKNNLLALFENMRNFQLDEIMKNVEKNEFEDNIKQALRTGQYAVCKKLGLESFAKKFGLTPEQFAENLRDNYQRHEIEQDPVEPNIIAQDYVASKFKSSDEVMKAVQLMVAIKLSREPLPIQELTTGQIMAHRWA
ncbi:hypothetical protein PV326_013117 [Microctonus aethiopoides]|nr:hypothetical protein PV326_013117 [Microctonus aethiopoides]